MARRRSARRRSGGGGAGLLLLVSALAAAVALGATALMALARWYARTWRQSGRNGRIALAGSLAVTLICVCGLASGPRPSSPPPSAAAPRPALAAAPPTATRPPTTTPRPSLTATPRPQRPTAAPSTTPAAPAGSVISSGNLRSEPRLVRETVIGTICAGDTIAFRSQQRVGDTWWYLVRVVARGSSCGASAAAVGAEGWASATLLTEPASDVAAYARAAGIALPTAIPNPTATARPTRRRSDSPAAGRASARSAVTARGPRPPGAAPARTTAESTAGSIAELVRIS